MSTHFNGYLFRKRNLWHVTTTLRSYLAATHRYALAAQLVSIAQYRKIVTIGDEHRSNCSTRVLGTCTCDFWHDLDTVRDYITDKQRDQNGLEAQCIEYGKNYLMRITGDYRWMPELPVTLLEYLHMENILYSDSSDVPPEMRPYRKLVERFDKELSAKRYFMIPLLTIDDINHMMWTMAAFLGKQAWKRRNQSLAD